MRKETVTYTDYNGVERTEDFFFNLNKAEIMEMEMGVKGGLAEQINAIVKAEDSPAIIALFKDLVLRSYGVKQPDGRGFKKTKELRDEFEWHPAYSVLFMKLATDADAAAAFVNGIVPADMAKQLGQ